MKTTKSLSLVILLFCLGCNFNSRSLSQMITEVRQNFAKSAEQSNEKTLAWERVVDSIYKVAGKSSQKAIDLINIIASKDTSIDSWYNLSELHFIKGNIYYHIDSFEKAVSEFDSAGKSCGMSSPKYLAASAGAYIKLKRYKNAFDDLKKAADINYDYLWNIGNYYEIIGKTDSAIFYYLKLYNDDTTYYKFCLERANGLKNKNTEPLTKLIYRDRERKVLLFMPVKK